MLWSGEHTKDRGEAKREEQAREDVVLLAEDAANERIVFVYRGLRPVQVPPTNTDKDKDKSAANATSGIGSKRLREEEQDDEYGVVYDVFRERRVGDRKGQATGSISSTGAPATSTTATTTTTTVSEGTTRGVRFAEGSKVSDGGGKPQRRRRFGTGTGSASAGAGGSDGKVVWRRTLVMHNVCESDVEFGKDGVCLWVKVAPPPAATTTSTTSTATATITSSTSATTTTTTTTAPTAAAGKEKEPRLTRLEVECHGKIRTAGTKDERRGVIFPCKVWRWRPPPRITRVRGQEGEGEGEEKKMEVEA